MMLDLSVIKSLCKKKGVTVKKFAEEIGLTDASVNRTIKNSKTTSDFLEKAAAYFGVSVDVFFGGNDTAPAILRKLVDAFFSEDKQKELVQSFHFISNMMDSLTIDDKDEIFILIDNKFKKIESYRALHYFEKISLNDIEVLSNYMVIDDIKDILRLAILRIVYNREGIEHFVEFWCKWKNRPNPLVTISLAE